MSSSPPPPGELLAEQMLYGSFPDKPGGYYVRYRSAGINDAIANSVVERCDSWGEIIHPGFTHSLMHLSIPAEQTGGLGPVAMIDWISHVGMDSSGRQGAQVHHVLILTPEEFGHFGADPFLLLEKGAFRESWPRSTPSGLATLCVPDVAEHHAAELSKHTDSHLRASLLAAISLIDRARLLFWVDSDPNEVVTVMRLAWILLPLPVRRRVRLATFAFLNRNDFDLAVVYSELAPTATRDVLRGGSQDIDWAKYSDAARSHFDRVWSDLAEHRFLEVAASLADQRGEHRI